MIRFLNRLWRRIFRHEPDERTIEVAEATLHRLRRRVEAIETLQQGRQHG